VCGITGFWGPPDRALLDAMTASLRHRGPDDDGYFENATGSLGFRRLSIIDLEHGNQPVSMDDGRLQMVYNGEVYNFRELRAELEGLGHTFQTTCDTEVVLHAYAQWGTDCFRRFNGMWGLAILDERASAPRLVLSRDHFGIKPLFYARHRGRVVFASEIKAILQDETFPREVDHQQMYEYLRFGLFDHNDGTFFRGIRQVPAAAFAVIEGSTISETVYWTPRLSEDGDASPEAFRAVFERAVQRRLVADVPVGICLSGGLDSSSICTVMAQQLHDHVRDTGRRRRNHRNDQSDRAFLPCAGRGPAVDGFADQLRGLATCGKCLERQTQDGRHRRLRWRHASRANGRGPRDRLRRRWQ